MKSDNERAKFHGVLNSDYSALVDKVVKLEQQLDKMKSCTNCKHGYYHNDSIKCKKDDWFCVGETALAYRLWELEE